MILSVRDVIEVEEDSPEAKKWPVYIESTLTDNSNRAKAEPLSTTSGENRAMKESTHPTKRLAPGPRKSKTALSAIPHSTKSKKISTLEKSAMDWQAHLISTNPSEKDELDANRLSGGYLEKVEFLKRVEDRKEDLLEVMKSSKRRKL